MKKMLSKKFIERAAHCCYYPNNDDNVQALIFVIEDLVLPKDKEGYTKEEKAEAITNALELKNE
jgi:hypothetical protein